MSLKSIEKGMLRTCFAGACVELAGLVTEVVGCVIAAPVVLTVGVATLAAAGVIGGGAAFVGLGIEVFKLQKADKLTARLSI